MRFPDPPKGLRAIPWRFPILLYKIGLGWLFGNRALLLSVKGRKSGKIRQTVLEIIHHLPEENSYYVASGFGTRSQWFKNFKNDPRVIIQVGSKRLNATGHQLNPEEAGTVLLAYAQKYPQAIRWLSKKLDYKITHTPEGYRDFAKELPIIKFTAREE